MAHIDATSRISTTTLDAALRIKVEPIFTKSFFLDALKQRGRLMFGQSGDFMTWRPRMRRRTITAGTGTNITIPFPQTNVRRKVSLPWRHYTLGESIEQYELLVNKDENAVFSIMEDAVDGAADDFIEDFRLKLYADGNAGAANDIHGLESCMQVTGLVANSKVGDPTDNYAGVATNLGVTGSWTPDSGDGWPTGQGSAEYKWWSPLVVDYQHTGWAGTANWTTSWQQAVRYGMTYQSVLQKRDPDTLLLNPEMLREAKDSLESSQRFVLNEQTGTTHVGHKTLLFEDVVIATEYGVPDGVGYFLNFDALELRCLTEQLVQTMQDTDITSGGTKLYSFQFWGNLLIQAPSFLCKLAPISALGT